MDKTSFAILVERAIIRASITSAKIEKLYTRARVNTMRRTTITLETVEDLLSDMVLINETLDQIKL